MASLNRLAPWLYKPAHGVEVDFSHPLAQFLRGFWLLSEEGGTAAANLAYPGLNNGAFTNSPTWAQTAAGSGVTFAGTNQNVNVGRGALLDDLPDQTFEALIYYGGTTGSSQRIVAKMNSSFYNGLMLTSGGNVEYQRDRATLENYYLTTAALTSGELYHLIGTHEFVSGATQVYINGVSTPASSSEIGSGALTSDAAVDLLLGNRSDNARPFKGTIIFARVWAMYTTPAIAEELYTNPYGIVAPRSPMFVLGFQSGPEYPSVSITPDAASAGASVVAPTVALGSLAIAPAVSSAATSIVAPTVRAGSVTVSPGASTAATSVAGPSVVFGSVSIAPSPASAATGVVAPSVALSALAIAPDPASAATTGQAPAVVIGGISITPSPAATSAVVAGPVVVLGSITFVPSAVGASASVVAPVVILGSISIAPASANAVADVAGPTVVLSGIVVAPAVASAVTAIIDPTVDAGGDVTLTPEPAVASTGITAPAVSLGALAIAPASANATVNVAEPTVVLSGIVIALTQASAAAAIINPTVEAGGDVVITPAPTVASTGITAPAVELGALALVPLPAAAQASVIDPGVILGSIVVTDIAWARAAIVDPTVIIVNGAPALSSHLRLSDGQVYRATTADAALTQTFVDDTLITSAVLADEIAR